MPPIRRALDTVSAARAALASPETRRFYGDDVCVVEHECRAIVIGHFAGIPGRGRRVIFRMLHIFEFRAGRISRENVWLDTATVIAQLAAPISADVGAVQAR